MLALGLSLFALCLSIVSYRRARALRKHYEDILNEMEDE